MKNALRVGIVGDYNPASRYHAATNAALRHAGDALAVPVEVTWVPTPAVNEGECGEGVGAVRRAVVRAGEPV